MSAADSTLATNAASSRLVPAQINRIYLPHPGWHKQPDPELMNPAEAVAERLLL